MSDYLQMPWSVEDTIDHMDKIRCSLIRRLRTVNLDGKAEQDVAELNFDFNRAINALKENLSEPELSFWQQKAKGHAAAAGELKIAVHSKANELSKRIASAQAVRSEVMTETDLAYIDGRIREMQEVWSWLKSLEPDNLQTPEEYRKRIMTRFTRRT